MQTFGQATYLGYLQLTLDADTREIKSYDGKLIPVNADRLRPDPVIAAKMAAYRAQFPELTEVVGRTDARLNRRYFDESDLGNLLADIAVESSGADIGLIHGGTIRKDIPKGDVEAADAYGLSGWTRFRRIIWPTMLRLAWPAYTNEAIFLFHATTLVFFSGFPAWQQKGDALYYANFFADKTFNPFVPYPILAGYFIVVTLCIIGVYGLINKRLNRHLPQDMRQKFRLRVRMIR